MPRTLELSAESPYGIDRIRAAVTGGVGIMPAFDEVLTEEEIETVSAYVATVAGKDDGATAAAAGLRARALLSGCSTLPGPVHRCRRSSR